MATNQGALHSRRWHPSLATEEYEESGGRDYEQQQRSDANAELARALGWFSLALGTAEVLAPRQLARFIGVNEEHADTLRLLGIREIASGVGLLAQPQQAPLWLKSRVAGDAMDLALLGAAMNRDDTDRNRLAGATLAVAGVTALDVIASRESAAEPTADTIIDIRKSIVINRKPEELYSEWRRFEQLPQIMRHLESVEELDSGRSHWVARAPGGSIVEWDAEIIGDEPGRLLAWRSLPDAEIENMGSVRFEAMPGGRGTLLLVELEYRPPGGKLGAQLAKLLGEEPEVQLNEDLRRFKQLMETGEIATTRSQPSGRRSLLYRFVSRKEPANES